MVIISRSYGH